MKKLRNNKIKKQKVLNNNFFWQNKSIKMTNKKQFMKL